LHTDAAEGGLGLAEAVVDVGPEGVQGHAAFAVRLLAGHLGTAQATGALDADPEGAGLLHRLDGSLHGPTEGDAAGQLVADPLGDEGGVQLGLLDLLDVQLDAVDQAGDLLDLLLQAVGLGPPPADDDAGAGGVDIDTEAVTRALHLDAAD